MQSIPDWLQIIIALAVYIGLMRWVFPRFGVST